jgi:dUTP pyrophosphatase
VRPHGPLAVDADEAGDVLVSGSWDPLEALADDGDGLDERSGERAAPAATELRFIRLSQAATLPTRAHDSDAGLDLYAAEAASVAPGGRVSVGTGLAVQIPEGLAGLVLPRSGLALQHGIALVNSPGLIDPGYRGEVRVLLLNTDPTLAFKVAPGDRIAQLMLVPITLASPLEADSLDTSARGPAGFGSSGA